MKDDKQRYAMILDDIEPLLKDAKGYELFLTGHRYVSIKFLLFL